MARLVRCPVCLRPSRDPGPRGQLRCRGCRRLFNGGSALPFDAGNSVVAGGRTDLLLSTGAVVVVALLVLLAVESMDWVEPSSDGPSFLWSYLVLALVLRAALALVRAMGLDTLAATLAALGVFECVGLLRWLEARGTGMHDFALLAVMMGFGIVLFLVRLDGFGQGGSAGRTRGSSGCSSSSCGGCGSGGGCGGCGGGD